MNVFDKLTTAITSPPSLPRDPNEFTSGEYARAGGISTTTAKRRLDVLAERGLVVRVTLRQMTAGNGVHRVPGWRYVGEDNIGAKTNGASNGRGRSVGRESKGEKVVVESRAAGRGGGARGADVRSAAKGR